MFERKKILMVMAATLLLATGPAKAQDAPKQNPVVVGQVNLTFYVASAAVVREVLERLGHSLTVVEGNHRDIYAKLGNQEVDMLVASWLPHAHGPLQAPIADQLVEAATLYEDARLYWAVPAHVPVSAVRTIDDLKKADVQARMEKDIVGVGPGSGLMAGSTDIMEEYGLATAGYSLRVAPAPEWAKNLADASASGKWMVMPLWQPQYLNAVYPVRVLEESRGIFGTDRAVVVVRKETWNGWPERTRKVLSRVHLGISVVTELERQIVVDGKEPRQAAREWMEANAQTVSAWFDD
ncbi:glycine betaine ABC transporter substrate-binding protein [Microvirga sp. G4-2]|uniref:glycine betaine ABC transporter substrate-binding protein n=1 Tax=Microvirga sp. G4-2 TaxID=3434467 RepID=UPI004044CD31